MSRTFSAGPPALPDDLESAPRRRHSGHGHSLPPPAYGHHGEPFSSGHHLTNLPIRSRVDSPSPSRHHSHPRADTPSPRAYSSPPQKHHHQSRAHSHPARQHSPPARARAPSPQHRRHGDEPEQRHSVREARGRRPHSPDSGPPRRDDRDHRPSRSHPPPYRHQARSPPPHRSASSRPHAHHRDHGDRHRSVPRRTGGGEGGGRKKRSSSAGWNPMWGAAAMTALHAGTVVAYNMRNDPGPWMGEKGSKVATAAIGAALVDTFMNQRHPRKVDGMRHKAIRRAATMALGRGAAATQARWHA